MLAITNLAWQVENDYEKKDGKLGKLKKKETETIMISTEINILIILY